MKFTLKPGMYVSTDGMDEETYYQVAKAFMAAGLTGGLQPYHVIMKGDRWGWFNYFDTFGWTGGAVRESLETEITIAQALSTLGGDAEEEWTPKAGEVAGVVEEVTGHMEYGQHVLGQQVEVKSIFMSGDVEVAAVEHNGVCYCFRTSMLRPIPAKSEREIAVEEIMEHMARYGAKDPWMAAADLYEAGYRRT